MVFYCGCCAIRIKFVLQLPCNPKAYWVSGEGVLIFRVVLTAVFVMILATPSFAIIEWYIQCNPSGTHFEGTVSIFNQYVQEGPVDGYELLFEQSLVGSCEPPVRFMAVPLPEPFHTVEYPISRLVTENNRLFRFEILLKKPDGSVLNLSRPRVPSWNVVSCGESVAARGYLTNLDQYNYVELTLCPGACDTWPCTGIDLGQIPEDQWLPFLDSGIPVDVYGYYSLYSMPGGACLIAQKIVPTPSDECGPVALEKNTWCSLKARYR
jgi:hypothetical protein